MTHHLKALIYDPCVTRGSHSFTCHPHTTNHTCLYSPAVRHHRALAGTHSSIHKGMARLSLIDLGGWLHTETNVPHRELNPDTVTHPSTNRAQRRLTSLIETNALPLHQTTIVILRVSVSVCHRQCHFMHIIMLSPAIDTAIEAVYRSNNHTDCPQCDSIIGSQSPQSLRQFTSGHWTTATRVVIIFHQQ